MNKYHCPKCGRFLEKTESEGLWCRNGCYESEYDLWKVMENEAKPVKEEERRKK